MITIVELAKLAGVSDATVSMVLSGKDRGRVGARRRQQILGLARKHGYRSNPAARALATGRTNRIGLCIAGTITSHALIGEFSLHMRLDLFAERLQRAGYAIEIIQVDPQHSPEELSRDLAQRAVDGLVFLNWPPDILEKPLFSLKERGVPAVASGTALNDDSFTWTEVDEPAAFEAAVRQLTSEGRTRIALVDTVVGTKTPGVDRAFKTAMRRYARCPAREVVIVQAAPLNYETVQQATRDLLRRQPDVQGIILTDNFLAQGILNALQAEGRCPGADVRVIGHGDTVFADQCSPKLSHYGLRIEEQVRLGTDALLEQIQGGSDYHPLHAMLPPEYIARET
jgi:DNA-binding LacI/PurR family transcriptional regulator